MKDLNMSYNILCIQVSCNFIQAILCWPIDSNITIDGECDEI